jgi:hypothetical protein
VWAGTGRKEWDGGSIKIEQARCQIPRHRSPAYTWGISMGVSPSSRILGRQAIFIFIDPIRRDC